MEEKAVRKLLHRRIKDCTISDGLRNFLITLFCLVSIIFYLGGKPNFSEFRVRVRALHDIGERSKGQTREGANDPVTEGDMASHRVMFHGLKNTFPSINIISEEHEPVDENVLATILPKLNLAETREEVNILGGEIEVDRLTIWIDPLDATQEYTENLTKFVTVMVGIAIDGRAIGGVIHKPFSNETIWSWKRQRNHLLNHLHILDEVELNRVYSDDEGPRVIVSRSTRA